MDVSISEYPLDIVIFPFKKNLLRPPQKPKIMVVNN